MITNVLIVAVVLIIIGNIVTLESQTLGMLICAMGSAALIYSVYLWSTKPKKLQLSQ